MTAGRRAGPEWSRSGSTIRSPESAGSRGSIGPRPVQRALLALGRRAPAAASGGATSGGCAPSAIDTATTGEPRSTATTSNGSWRRTPTASTATCSRSRTRSTRVASASKPAASRSRRRCPGTATCWRVCVRPLGPVGPGPERRGAGRHRPALSPCCLRVCREAGVTPRLVPTSGAWGLVAGCRRREPLPS
jgi:hypothetical protein